MGDPLGPLGAPRTLLRRRTLLRSRILLRSRTMLCSRILLVAGHSRILLRSSLRAGGGRAVAPTLTPLVSTHPRKIAIPLLGGYRDWEE